MKSTRRTSLRELRIVCHDGLRVLVLNLRTKKGQLSELFFGVRGTEWLEYASRRAERLDRSETLAQEGDGTYGV